MSRLEAHSTQIAQSIPAAAAPSDSQALLMAPAVSGAPWLVDDATSRALDDQEAKKKMMPTASNPRLLPPNLINCNLYD